MKRIEGEGVRLTPAGTDRVEERSSGGRRRPHRAMNITGEPSGKGASQAHAAVPTPPSTENANAPRARRRAARSVGGAKPGRKPEKRASGGQPRAAETAEGLAPVSLAAGAWAAHRHHAQGSRQTPANPRVLPRAQATEPPKDGHPQTSDPQLSSRAQTPAGNAPRSVCRSRLPYTRGRDAGRRRLIVPPPRQNC